MLKAPLRYNGMKYKSMCVGEAKLKQQRILADPLIPQSSVCSANYYSNLDLCEHKINLTWGLLWRSICVQNTCKYMNNTKYYELKCISEGSLIVLCFFFACEMLHGNSLRT